MLKSYKNVFFCLSFISFLLVTAPAIDSLAQEEKECEEYSAVFLRANSLYGNKEYEAAVQEYEKLIESGLRSANIFYNLGNSYFRMKNYGKAILYYERAFRMRPRDADIRANLSFAQAQVQGNGGDYNEQWYKKVFLFLRGFISVGEMTLLISALYFVTIILAILSVLLKAQRRIFLYFVIASFTLFIVVLPSFINGIYESEFQEKAVVMAREMEVRFEPNDEAKVYFKLYEGSVIQVIKSQGEWNQIKRYDGKMGWLKGNDFEVI